MMDFLIKSSCCLALLYAIFWWLFRQTTFYRLNRVVLLGIALLSLAMPLIPVTLSLPGEDVGQAMPNIEFLTAIVDPAAAIEEQSAEGGELTNTPVVFDRIFSLSNLMLLVYGGGVVWLLFGTGRELFHLLRLLRKGEWERGKVFTLVKLQESVPPLAFFNFVVINPADHSSARLNHILSHEAVHVREWHTLDILFLELFTAILWFHPLAWKLRNRAKLNLEFIADRTAIASVDNRKAYQLDMLQLSLPVSPLPTANYFNQSHIKTRIVMMNCKRSTRLSLWKYGSLLPVLAFLLVFLNPVSGQHRLAEPTASGLNVKPGQSIYMKISGNFTKKDVDKILARLEETGVDLTGTEFDYNSDGKITRARLQVKVGDYEGSVQSSNSAGPIKEPVIFYFSRKAGDKVGISVGTPKTLDREERKVFQNFEGILIGTFEAD